MTPKVSDISNFLSFIFQKILFRKIIFKQIFPKKIEGSQVQLCVRPAALGNVGPPCENMQLRVRIQGEALERPLRHCIELASLRTGLGNTSGQHSVTHELTQWIILQGRRKVNALNTHGSRGQQVGPQAQELAPSCIDQA